MDRDFAGEMLGYLLMIAGGLVFSAWFFCLTPDNQQQFVDRVLGLFTLILAQPGVIATAKIANNNRLSLRKRVFWAIAVFGVFACAIPMLISNWLSPMLVVPH